ncbi:MAG TPA: FKBP-type peptidyl-prolyl cis-trans isomerase [Gammaproteobacteria bacterium]|nr:FKBP-type peptidyl-prolyl cis-trans isomerase [Gammaproteobacteria bacterium]
MAEAAQIQAGSRVTMHFSIALEDGMVAEDSAGGEPLTFVMGDGTVVEGLELALYGLRAGDTQSLRLEPEQTFGYRDPDNVHTLPRSDFPVEMNLEPGTIIGFTTPGGDEVPGAVQAVQGDEVKVDFNHPLAGHTLTFEVRILAVEPPGADDD